MFTSLTPEMTIISVMAGNVLGIINIIITIKITLDCYLDVSISIVAALQSALRFDQFPSLFFSLFNLFLPFFIYLQKVTNIISAFYKFTLIYSNRQT